MRSRASPAVTRLAVIMLLALGLITIAGADPVELVGNGEFETPTVTDTAQWELFDTVDPWTTTDERFELWLEGAVPADTSPTTGSDGNPTGQHLQMLGDDDNTSSTITQSFVVPSLADGTWAFSFDAWKRGTGIGTYSVSGSSSGSLVSATAIAMSTSVWTSNTPTPLSAIVPNETITLTFTASGDDANCPHIDQVSFKAGIVPEPFSMAFLGSAFVGVVACRLRKRRKEGKK